MPYEMKWEANGLYKRYWGYITGSELYQSIAEQCRDDRYKQISYVINNSLDVTGHEATDSDHVNVLAQLVGARVNCAPLLTAVITTDPAVASATREIASMAKVASTVLVEVFTSEADARRWISDHQTGAPAFQS